MTFFEYALIPVSMLLALAVARILDGLYDEIRSEGRYWVHLVYLVVVGLNVLQFLDGAWSSTPQIEASRDSVLPAILLGSTVPGLLVLQAYALTTARPDTIEDWRAHFYAIRRPFFLLNGLRGAFLLTTIVVFRAEAPGPLETAQIAFPVLYSAVGWLSANPRWHATLALIVAANTALYLVQRVIALG